MIHLRSVASCKADRQRSSLLTKGAKSVSFGTDQQHNTGSGIPQRSSGWPVVRVDNLSAGERLKPMFRRSSRSWRRCSAHSDRRQKLEVTTPHTRCRSERCVHCPAARRAPEATLASNTEVSPSLFLSIPDDRQQLQKEGHRGTALKEELLG